MHVIGITGGVGAGKSTVLNYLKERYQARILLMDEVGHLLMQKDGRCYQKIRDLLGNQVLREDGEFDRQKIAALIFANTELLIKMNAIVHPEVHAFVEEAIQKEKNSGTEWMFLESAILLEEKYDEICEEIWYVYADDVTRRERLKANRSYSDDKVTSIMKKQMSDEEFRKAADFVIDNSRDFEEVTRQIDQRMR